MKLCPPVAVEIEDGLPRSVFQVRAEHNWSVSLSTDRMCCEKQSDTDSQQSWQSSGGPLSRDPGQAMDHQKLFLHGCSAGGNMEPLCCLRELALPDKA